MFSERFDILMNIAEISNSKLGRNINMNPSYIGRLRSGARPLPKKHDYLESICRCIADHIRNDYQLTALQKLTGIGSQALASRSSAARYLANWLSEQDTDTSEATGRLISGFSRPVSKTAPAFPGHAAETSPMMNAPFLYGNAGKRKAVEQFFTAILQEEKPQTLLLFSDENMAWLYEDAAFAARWSELFTKVILKGNRVKIIHTVARDMNEMLEAVTKWIPIYMTGMLEPYFYPRLRDGLFQRTMFIAPNTAAIVSSSVQQDTDGMLNMFITDRTALNALTAEYERYLTLCRPLMRVFTPRDSDSFKSVLESLADAEGSTILCTAMPPLFAMPEQLAHTLSDENGPENLAEHRAKSLESFLAGIEKHRFTLMLLDPELALLSPESLSPYTGDLFSSHEVIYTKEQYEMHIESLMRLEEQYENFTVRFLSEQVDNMMLYVKEDAGVIMAKASSPKTAFIINERNMINAFWDYLEKMI